MTITFIIALRYAATAKQDYFTVEPLKIVPNG
jgi:hypothetical protein